MFFMKFLKTLFLFFARLLRFGIISGAIFAGIAYVIDGYTRPQYGIANIYLIIACLAFFPLFAGITFEDFLRRLRKKKRKKLHENTEYLKESVTNQPLI